MNIKEFVPKAGLLFQDYSLYPVLCKPKLMPLKSVTLEKLEQMQKEAQEKVIQMEIQAEKEGAEERQQRTADDLSNATDVLTAGGQQNIAGGNTVVGGTAQNVDVWRPEDDVDDQQDEAATAL